MVVSLIFRCVFYRDLKGVGVAHLGAKSKLLIQKSLEVATGEEWKGMEGRREIKKEKREIDKGREGGDRMV